MLKIKKFIPLIMIGLFTFSSCAVVRPFEREKLADPIMEAQNEFSKQSLDQKFFSSREGSIGGASGIGGGCGCAK